MLVFRARARIVLIAASPVMIGSLSSLSSLCFGTTPTFSTGILTGTIQNTGITEASGIAASRMNPNVLWTHNDSGNLPQVFAMTPAGATLATYSVTATLPVTVNNMDWEDIAVGPGPTGGTNYLYIGDIGDNNANRANIQVYRVAEPAVSDTQSPISASLGGTSKFTFVYPDGARDAESMFVDPLTKDIYIISKRDTTKHVYRAPYPQSTSGTTTLTLVTTLNNSNWITAADISPDGNEIIMRAGATDTGLMYIRPSGGSIADAFATTPISIPLHSETQGEAIGFDPNGWGYYTTSEGANQPIYYFNRLPPPAGTMYWDNDGVAAGSYQSTGAGMGGAGTWNTSLKWYNGSAEIAWVSGNDAVFWGTAGTVTLSSPKTVNSLTFKTSGYVVAGSALTLGGSSITVDSGVAAIISAVVAGSAGLVKNGGGTLTLTNTNTYSGPTVVSAGTLSLTKSLMNSASLSVNSGATLAMASGSVTVLKTAIISITGTGKLDLTDNDLIVTGMNYSSVESLVKSGFGNFNWQGTGITSATAATFAQSDASRMLGVVNNAETGYSSFSGQTVGGSDVLVKFTYNGDANVDGKVNADDFTQFILGFSGGGSIEWLNGDFDYNNLVNADDFNAFIAGMNAFNASGGTPLSESFKSELALFATTNAIPLVLNPAPVPEPTALVILGLGCAAFLTRRARRGEGKLPA